MTLAASKAGRWPAVAVAVAVAAAVAVVVVVGGCSHGDTLGRLRKAPEAALRYPGATVLEVISHTPGPAPENSADHLKASFHVRTEARATTAEIIVYFSNALVARGWRRDDNAPDNLIGYFKSETWRKDGRVFALDLAHGSHGVTVIETTLTYS